MDYLVLPCIAFALLAIGASLLYIRERDARQQIEVARDSAMEACGAMQTERDDAIARRDASNKLNVTLLARNSDLVAENFHLREHATAPLPAKPETKPARVPPPRPGKPPRTA